MNFFKFNFCICFAIFTMLSCIFEYFLCSTFSATPPVEFCFFSVDNALLFLGYLCSPDANVYEIEFTRFRLRNMDSNDVLFEVAKPGACPLIGFVIIVLALCFINLCFFFVLFSTCMLLNLFYTSVRCVTKSFYLTCGDG